MTLSRSLSSLISFVHIRGLPLPRSFSAVHSSRYYPIAGAQGNPKNGTTDTPSQPLPSSTPDTPSSSKVPASNTKPPQPSVPPRPSTIPWQVKAANMVQLTGSISIPPKTVTSTDGVFTAVSVLVQEDSMNPNLPDLWIPVIFQGTLAESAATHLREKDIIYVTGHLARAAEQAPQIKDVPESGLQLIVNDFKIVLEKKIDIRHTPQKVASKSIARGTQSAKPNNNLWMDLVTNPNQWIDCRLHKLSGSANPRNPDFKQKDSGQGLWVNTAPQWVSEKLGGLSFPVLECDSQNTSSTSTSWKAAKSRGAQSAKPSNNLWMDLVTNPNQWIDCRLRKLSGLANPRSPDFKQKDSSQGLWVDTAPQWASEKLGGLSFPVLERDSQNTSSTSTSWKTAKSNDAGNKMLENSLPWNDLVTNPHQWVDYRMSKQNGSVKPRHPDFKNKELQQSLWLDRAPKSVLEKVNTLTFALPGGDIGRAKLTSTSWSNPTSQYDRLDKAYEKGYL